MARNYKERCFLTENELQRMLAMYNEGYLPDEIGREFGCVASTVGRHLQKRFGIKSEAFGAGPFSPIEDKRIIRFTRMGKSCAYISKILRRSYNSVYSRKIALGLDTGKGGKDLVDGYRSNNPIEVGKFRDAIYPDDLVNMRASVKVGDIIQVRTLKASSAAMNTGASSSGVMRNARVVNVDHPRFCLARLLDSGILESRLWVDMVMEKKAAERAELIGDQEVMA